MSLQQTSYRPVSGIAVSPKSELPQTEIAAGLATLGARLKGLHETANQLKARLEPVMGNPKEARVPPPNQVPPGESTLGTEINGFSNMAADLSGTLTEILERLAL